MFAVSTVVIGFYLARLVSENRQVLAPHAVQILDCDGYSFAFLYLSDPVPLPQSKPRIVRVRLVVP
jgi:hypothetical protein